MPDLPAVHGALVLQIVAAFALTPQPVKEIGLYPLTTIQTVFQTGLSEPIGLAGTDHRAGVSLR